MLCPDPLLNEEDIEGRSLWKLFPLCSDMDLLLHCRALPKWPRQLLNRLYEPQCSADTLGGQQWIVYLSLHMLIEAAPLPHPYIASDWREATPRETG